MLWLTARGLSKFMIFNYLLVATVAYLTVLMGGLADGTTGDLPGGLVG